MGNAEREDLFAMPHAEPCKSHQLQNVASEAIMSPSKSLWASPTSNFLCVEKDCSFLYTAVLAESKPVLRCPTQTCTNLPQSQNENLITVIDSVMHVKRAMKAKFKKTKLATKTKLMLARWKFSAAACEPQHPHVQQQQQHITNNLGNHCCKHHCNYKHRHNVNS